MVPASHLETEWHPGSFPSHSKGHQLWRVLAPGPGCDVAPRKATSHLPYAWEQGAWLVGPPLSIYHIRLLANHAWQAQGMDITRINPFERTEES